MGSAGQLRPHAPLDACCTVSRNAANGAPVTHVGPSGEKSGNGTDGMVLVADQEFLMGSDSPKGFRDDGEAPVRKVAVDPFYIDVTAVTNGRFADFVDDIGFVTEAERFNWSFVYGGLVPTEVARTVGQTVAVTPWWWQVNGSTWRAPFGPGTTIEELMDHPVVHVSWNDAEAYARWAGKRLPSEAEWEMAARGGLDQAAYPWGDELTPGGKHMCNIWQGNFPDHNTGEDGYVATAPAMSYSPNGYGLFNASGNVWEWCADWFSPDFHVRGPRKNPRGPLRGQARVVKGGSYMCHDSYCNRYRMGARSSTTPDTSAGHQGFRCTVTA